MTTLALVNPNTLTGTELRGSLQQRHELWDELRLLTTDSTADATLTELDGAAALVHTLEPDSLDGVDLAFVCGQPDAASAPWPRAPAGATTILLADGDAPADGVPVVAGVNLEVAARGGLLVSPHPAVVMLAHLLAPLLPFGLEEVSAWLVQPATMHGRDGMDELMDQTRALLAFRPDGARAVFGEQLAFNVLPADAPTGALADQLQTVLGERPPTALQLVQGGVFHSFTASLLVRLGNRPSAGKLARTMAERPVLEPAEQPGTLGPIAVAGRDEILLGEPAPMAGRPGCYWLWAVMDNLTRGGATNAMEIAEAVL